MPEPDVAGEKLFALARAARARVEARQGAAVVDETGRTYVGATVELPRLRLSALGLAVASAAAAGAQVLVAAVIVGSDLAADDVALFSELAGPDATLAHVAGEWDARSTWRAP